MLFFQLLHQPFAGLFYLSEAIGIDFAVFYQSDGKVPFTLADNAQVAADFNLGGFDFGQRADVLSAQQRHKISHRHIYFAEVFDVYLPV